MRFIEIDLGDARRSHPVPDGEMTVGRGDGCDVVIDHPSVSRSHARIVAHSDRAVRVEDLGSTNGVWFDGRRVERCEVGENQTFMLGSIACVLRDAVTLGEEPTRSGRRTRPTPVERADPAWLDSGPGRDRYLHPPDDFLADRPEIVRRLAWSLHRLAPHLSVTCVRETGAGDAVDPLAGPWDPRWLDCADAASDATKPSERLVLPVGGCPPASRLVLAPWPHGGSFERELRFLAELLAAAIAADPGPTPNRAVRTEGPKPVDVVVDARTRQAWREATRLGFSDVSVLLWGESGVGKERLAHRVHEASPRRDGPYLALNCTAIPRELLEAELFGIERGVATGVDARPGKFRLAHGGTLFLDEVGDLPPHLQPKLLRALETGEVLPLGAEKPVQVDVRIVSATHQDLRARIAERTFREDLYYRLAGAVVAVPALRDRRDDIVPLARRFASAAAVRSDRTFRGFERAFLEALLGYGWPGNVRELRNAVERAAALAEGPILEARHLPGEITGTTDRELGAALLGVRDDWRTARDRFARLYFRNLLDTHGDNLSEAAKKAGLSRSSLYKLLDDLELR